MRFDNATAIVPPYQPSNIPLGIVLLKKYSASYPCHWAISPWAVNPKRREGKNKKQKKRES